MASWWRRLIQALAVVLLLAFAGGGPVPNLVGANPALAQTKGAAPGQALGNRSDSDFWRTMRRGGRGPVPIPDKQAGGLVPSDAQHARAVRNGPAPLRCGGLDNPCSAWREGAVVRCGGRRQFFGGRVGDYR